ncbi:MAG: NusG domain II-containing protein [Oscillospiraceae bacterium]|nr:NusG domain II-containing protein [Oscillospiraceae bacterium]
MAAQIWINNLKFENPVAQIYQNGELLHNKVPLLQNQDFPLNGNLVQVRNGKIGITEASCPDKICVKTGFVNGVIPVICLPNRVEVRIANHKSDIDGITG